MSDKNAWYRQDAFWELFEPLLFNQQRQSLAQEQVNQIEKLLKLEVGATILDLCCGNGRHSVELSARGYDVTGVDRTERYIDTARQVTRKRNLTATFVVSDMREYRSPNLFDVVLNLFGSFGYFEDPSDDYRVIENMYRSLRPGGKLLVETMGKEILARNFKEKDWAEERGLLVLSEKKITQNWGRVETRWIVIRGTERTEHRVSIRSYSAVELSSLFESTGFSGIQVYGGLDGIRYNLAAQRLVVVGHKV